MAIWLKSFRSLRLALTCAWLALLFACPTHPQALAVPPDSPRWNLEGEAKLAEYQGRKCLRIDGGAAVLKDFEMRDAVIDVDIATPATRGFFGLDIRIDHDDANYEEIYLRQHKSGLPDAMQYTPVLHTGRNWQIYNGPGFTGAVDIPENVWFHLRLEVTGAQAKLYVKDMEKPALVMDDLKSGVQQGKGGPVHAYRRNLLLEFRSPRHVRCPVAAPSSFNASQHSNQVEHLSLLRRAPAQS